MGFENIMEKFRRFLLCCSKVERKRSLDIGSPTDVRRMDITEGMPNLTEADAKIIREEASHDAIRLLSLQSHPPTQPPSPTSLKNKSPLHLPPHPHALPKAPSPATPASLPRPPQQRLRQPPHLATTPPRQKHSDTSPPAFRMKSMWERTRRLSRGASLRSTHRSSAGYAELEKAKGGVNESVVVLDLDPDTRSIRVGEDASVKSGKSGEGFEVQNTVGGTPVGTPRKGAGPDAVRADKYGNGGESSESEREGEGVERKPLVRV
ncbi:hypothetical protein N0V90_006890 [Kalmusia sp. IMI 367209]|nr:hypothetical protein N0V90_006890 [Kalmusia sp. IMI 367209]